MSLATAVKLEQQDQGLPWLRVQVEGHVTVQRAKELQQAVAAEVDGLAGRSFGLLFDLRKVTRFDDDGGPVMQAIEMDAASRGLERVAHLVAQQEVVAQLDAELKALKGDKLIGNFTDEAKARAWLAGVA